MRKDDAIRIRHMFEALNEALAFAEGKSRDDFMRDRMLVLSVVKCIEIIGEAASKITSETRTRHLDIPWVEIIAMRNRLIHVYYDIDIDRVWDTIVDDLPTLKKSLSQLTQFDGLK
jgi:uncharacterized protein with HEPN domain